MARRPTSSLPRRTFVAVAGLAVVGASGCTGAAPRDPNAPSPELAALDARIAGVWRLSNYIPDQELPPKLLMAMQSDKIMVRFEEGMMRSVSPSLQFEQAYRIADVNGDTFHLFVRDPGGAEVDALCALDNLGSMSFEVLTPPWKGRGVITREGTALEPVR